MKQKILFLVTLVLLAVQGWAAPVDLSKAQAIAQSFASANGHFNALPLGYGLKLAHAEPSGKLKEHPVFYVFNSSDSYIIVAGDDRAEEILGYGEGQFDINDIPCGMRDLFNVYKEEIEFLQTHPKLSVERVSQSTPSLMSTSVSPLISTNWGQESPYNNQCPMYGSERCITGCVATAMAQIMQYWQYPSSAPAMSAYTTSSLNISVPKLPAKSLSYNKSNDAIAWLMRYAGQAVSMDYQPASKGGSGAEEAAARSAMVNKFGYSTSALLIYKSNYTDTQWKNKLNNELNSSRPVYYQAIDANGNGGHAFIIDGYNTSGKYHINWGWKGSSNGYFELNSFNTNGLKFNVYQNMIVDLRPMTILSINPNPVAFTNKTVGVTYTASISIKGYDLTGDLTLKLTGATVFSINKTSITKSAATSGTTITVTYKPTAAGTQTATLTISGGGLTSNKTVSIKGTSVVRTITTSPTSLPFGSVIKGKSVSKTIKVTGTNLTGSLTLKSNNSLFTLSSTTITAAEAATGKTVTVTYKPTAKGSNSGTITISGGGATSKTVYMTGNCIDPTITPSVVSLKYLNVLKGNSMSKTFTVKGTDLTGSLTLKSNSTYYTVSPTTITAAEAATGKTVTVTFKPTAEGSYSGKITISGGSAASKTVSLTGICVVPKITTSVSSLHFSANDAKSFTVKGTNLTGSLTVKSSSSYFKVSPSTITIAEAKAGKSITVLCVVPASLQRATGTITISGGGASSKTVSVSYAKNQPVMISSVEPEGGIEDGNDELINGGLQSANGDITSSVNELAMNSRIYAEGHSIIIDSPVGQEAIISDISGRAQRVNLQAGHNEIPVNASGVYIVRIREKTAKLMIK